MGEQNLCDVCHIVGIEHTCIRLKLAGGGSGDGGTTWREKGGAQGKVEGDGSWGGGESSTCVTYQIVHKEHTCIRYKFVEGGGGGTRWR